MSELFSQLGVNWKLLVAQAANFLLLLWLLNRFAFRKFLSFLEGRQRYIQKGIEMRAQAEREFERIQNTRERELEKARREAETIVAQAKALAQARKREILESAREQAEDIVYKGKLEAERAKREAIAESAEEVQKFTILLAEKILNRTITEKDEEKIVKEVLEKYALYEK